MIARKPAAPPWRMIHTRRLLKRGDDGAYQGTITVWGFSYEVECRRVGDCVEVIVFDGAEPIGLYRQELIDEPTK